jgi:hypothetical protein
VQSVPAPLVVQEPLTIRPRLPVWTWIFIIWISLVISRAISDAIEDLTRGRTAVATTKLVVGALFALGIILLFQRRPKARGFWLVVLSFYGAVSAWLGMFLPADRHDLLFLTALWFAAWALYFARSKRLRAALQNMAAFEPPAV